MFTDPVAALFLGVLTLFPAAMVVFFLVSAVTSGGIRFFPVPVIAQRVVFSVLAGIAFWVGWSDGNSLFLWFVVLSTLALGLQHGGPKHWCDGKVRGVWLRPLAVRSQEREAGRLVLVLENGVRLGVPDNAANRAFLETLG